MFRTLKGLFVAKTLPFVLRKLCVILLVVLLCGAWCGKTLAQPGVTYDVYNFGGLEFRVYREGAVYPF